MATEEQKNNQQTLNDLLNDYKSGQIEAAEYTAVMTSRTADLSDALRQTVKLKKTSSELDKQLLGSVKRISDLARTLESPYKKISDVQKDIVKSQKEQIKLDNTLAALKNKLGATIDKNGISQLKKAEDYIALQEKVITNEEDFERARASASAQEKIYADELVASERALQSEVKKRSELLKAVNQDEFNANKELLEEKKKSEKDAINEVSQLRQKQLEASQSLEAATKTKIELEESGADTTQIEEAEAKRLKAQQNYDLSKEATLNKELQIKEITRDITSFAEESFTSKEKELLTSFETTKNLEKEKKATKEIIESNKSIDQTLVNQIAQKGVILDTSIDELATAEEKLSTDAKIYAQGIATSKINKTNAEYLETQKEYLRDIQKRQAAYNLTLGFAEGLLKKLGANNAAIALGLEEGKKAAEEMAKAIEEGKETSGIFGGQLKILGAGIKGTFKGMADGLKNLSIATLLGVGIGKAVGLLLTPVKKAIKGAFDAIMFPAKKIFGEIQGYFSSFVDYISSSFFSIQGLVDTFNKGDQLSKQLSQATEDIATGLGVSTQEAENLTDQVRQFSGELGAFPEVLAQNMVALNQAFGTTQKFSDETARSFNRMVERLGFSTEEAAEFVKIAKITGETENDILGGIEDQTMALKNQYGVAISQKSVFQDISKASSATRLSLGNNTKELTNAAFQAKRLGLEMNQVASMGSNLLEFESSIANEMEAELLIGRDLNLERARAAFLNNDIATAAEEIAGQIGSAADFSKMNVIQQEALAKAVGTNREGLADMLETQEMLANTGFKDMSEAQQEFNKLVESGMNIEQAQAEFRERYGNEALATQAAQVSYAKQREMQERALIASASKIAEALMPVARALRNFQERIEEIRVVMIDQMRPFFKELGSFVGDAGDQFAIILESYIKPLGKRLNDIGLTLIGFARKNGPEFKKTFESILDVFGSIYGLVGDIIKELFNIKGTSNVADPLKNTLQLVQDIAKDIVSYVKSIDAGGIAKTIQSVITGIGNFYQGLYNFVKGTITTIKGAIDYVTENPITSVVGAGLGIGLAKLLKRGSSRLFPMFTKNVDGPGGGGMFDKLLKGLKGKEFKGGQFMPGGGRAPAGGAVAGRNIMGLQLGSTLGGSAGPAASALGGTALGAAGVVAGAGMAIGAVGKGIYDVAQLNEMSTAGEEAVAKGGLGGALGGAAAGAAIGSVIPVVGTVLGAGIGALVGYAGGRMIGGLDRFEGKLDKARKKYTKAFEENQRLTNYATTKFNTEIANSQILIKKRFEELGGDVDLEGDINMSKTAIRQFAQEALNAGNITKEQFKDAINGTLKPLDLLEAAAEGARTKLENIRDLVFEGKEKKEQEAREAAARGLNVNLDLTTGVAEGIGKAKETGLLGEEGTFTEEGINTISSTIKEELSGGNLKNAFSDFTKFEAPLYSGGGAMGAGGGARQINILPTSELVNVLKGKESSLNNTQSEVIKSMVETVENSIGSAGLLTTDQQVEALQKAFPYGFDFGNANSIDEFAKKYSSEIIKQNETLIKTIETDAKKAGSQELRKGVEAQSLFTNQIRPYFSELIKYIGTEEGGLSTDVKDIDPATKQLITGLESLNLPEIDKKLQEVLQDNLLTGDDLNRLQEILVQSDVEIDTLQTVSNAFEDATSRLESLFNTTNPNPGTNVTQIPSFVSVPQQVQDGSSISHNGPFTIQDSKGNVAITHPKDKLVVSPNVSYIADGATGKGGPVFPVSEKFGALDVKVGKEGVLVQKINDGITGNPTQYINDGISQDELFESYGITTEAKTKKYTYKPPKTSSGRRSSKGSTSTPQDENLSIIEEMGLTPEEAHQRSQDLLSGKLFMPDRQLLEKNQRPYYEFTINPDEFFDTFTGTSILDKTQYETHPQAKYGLGLYYRASKSATTYNPHIIPGYSYGVFDQEDLMAILNSPSNTTAKTGAIGILATTSNPDFPTLQQHSAKGGIDLTQDYYTHPQMGQIMALRDSIMVSQTNPNAVYYNDAVTPTVQYIQDGETGTTRSGVSYVLPSSDYLKRSKEMGFEKVAYSELSGTTSSTKVVSPSILSDLGVSGVSSSNYKGLFRSDSLPFKQATDRKSFYNNIKLALDSQSLKMFTPAGKAPATDSFSINYAGGETDNIYNSGNISFPKASARYSDIENVEASGNGLLALGRAIAGSSDKQVPSKVKIGFQQERTSTSTKFDTDQINNLVPNFNSITNAIMYHSVPKEDKPKIPHFVNKNLIDKLGTLKYIKSSLNSTQSEFLPSYLKQQTVESIESGSTLEDVYSQIYGMAPLDLSVVDNVVGNLPILPRRHMTSPHISQLEKGVVEIGKNYVPQYKENVLDFLAKHLTNDPEQLGKFVQYVNPKWYPTSLSSAYDRLFENKEYKKGTIGSTSLTKKTGEYEEGASGLQQVNDGIGFWEVISNPMGAVKHYVLPTLMEESGHIIKSLFKTKALSTALKGILKKTPVLGWAMHAGTGALNIKHLLHEEGMSEDQLNQEVGTAALVALGGIGGGIIGGMLAGTLSSITGPGAIVIGTLGGIVGSMIGEMFAEFAADTLGAEPVGRPIVSMFKEEEASLPSYRPHLTENIAPKLESQFEPPQNVLDGYSYWDVITDPTEYLRNTLSEAGEIGLTKLVNGAFAAPAIRKGAINLSKATTKRLPFIGPVIEALVGGYDAYNAVEEYKNDPQSPPISELYQELGTIGYETLGGIGGSLIGGLALTPALGPVGTFIGGLLGGLGGQLVGSLLADIFGAESMGRKMTNFFTSVPQQVQDGSALSSRGPFTITDKFGATAITAKGDGVVVSPNISYVNDGIVDAEPINQIATSSTQQHTTVIEQDNSELKQELESMKQLMSELIKELPTIANRPITIELDGNKVGEGLGRIGYRG